MWLQLRWRADDALGGRERGYKGRRRAGGTGAPGGPRGAPGGRGRLGHGGRRGKERGEVRPGRGATEVARRGPGRGGSRAAGWADTEPRLGARARCSRGPPPFPLSPASAPPSFGKANTFRLRLLRFPFDPLRLVPLTPDADGPAQRLSEEAERWFPSSVVHSISNNFLQALPQALPSALASGSFLLGFHDLWVLASIGYLSTWAKSKIDR